MGTSSPHRKPYERLTVVLTSADRAALEALLRGGTAPVRTIKRARVLQLLDQGWTTAEVREAVGVCHDTVLAVGHRYRDGGLGRALYEAPRPGGTRVLDDAAAARIIALACGPPPAGFARWTVRLLTDHAPRPAGIPPVGHETLRQVLAHHDLKPWREKNVVRAGADARVPGVHGGRAGDLRTAVRPARTGRRRR